MADLGASPRHGRPQQLCTGFLFLEEDDERGALPPPAHCRWWSPSRACTPSGSSPRRWTRSPICSPRLPLPPENFRLPSQRCPGCGELSKGVAPRATEKEARRRPSAAPAGRWGRRKRSQRGQGSDCFCFLDLGVFVLLFCPVSFLQSSSTCQKVIKRLKSFDQCFLQKVY